MPWTIPHLPEKLIREETRRPGPAWGDQGIGGCFTTLEGRAPIRSLTTPW